MLPSDTLGPPPWFLHALCFCICWPAPAVLCPGATGALCLQVQRAGRTWELRLPGVGFSPGLCDAGYQSPAPLSEQGQTLRHPLYAGVSCRIRLKTWPDIELLLGFFSPSCSVSLIPLPASPGNKFLQVICVWVLVSVSASGETNLSQFC